MSKRFVIHIWEVTLCCKSRFFCRFASQYSSKLLSLIGLDNGMGWFSCLWTCSEGQSLLTHLGTQGSNSKSGFLRPGAGNMGQLPLPGFCHKLAESHASAKHHLIHDRRHGRSAPPSQSFMHLISSIGSLLSTFWKGRQGRKQCSSPNRVSCKNYFLLKHRSSPNWGKERNW